MLYLFLGFFKHFYHTVAPSIEFRVFLLAFGMLKDVFQRLLQSLVEAGSGTEPGYGSFQFAVVEVYATGFVSYQAAGEVVIAYLCKE